METKRETKGAEGTKEKRRGDGREREGGRKGNGTRGNQ